MTPRERFLNLLKNDILKLDLAELNFGIYRVLNARRDLVLRFLEAVAVATRAPGFNRPRK